MNRVDKTEAYLSTIPLAHQNMMIKYRDHLFRIRNCIGEKKHLFQKNWTLTLWHILNVLDENFQIIRKLVEDVGNLFENANQAMVPNSHNNRYEDDDIRVRLQDMDKVNGGIWKLSIGHAEYSSWPQQSVFFFISWKFLPHSHYRFK